MNLLGNMILAGLMRRRILVNFRVRPEALAGMVPAPFRLKLIESHVIAGICLIRLAEVRPRGLPAWLGLASENAAHRIAVEWDEGGVVRSGVYVPRRDTDSWINRLAGGRVFPGHHGAAKFQVQDVGGKISIEVEGRESGLSVLVRGEETDRLTADSVFRTLDEANEFFQEGSVGWSATPNPDVVDGMELSCTRWKMRPLAVSEVSSDFIARLGDAAEFDSAFVMRGIELEWHSHGTRRLEKQCGSCVA